MAFIIKVSTPLEDYIDGVDRLAVPAGAGLSVGDRIVLTCSSDAHAEFHVLHVSDDGTVKIGPAIVCD